MSFSDLLNKTCTVKSKSQSQGANGEIADSFSDLFTNVPCRVNYDRNIPNAQNIGNVSNITGRVYIASSYAITNGMLIVVDGGTFEITNAVKDSSQHHWEIQVKRTDYD